MALRSRFVLALLFCASIAGGAQANERRVVRYIDGTKPTFQLSEGRMVRGPIELEVRLEGINPLCYRYVTRVDGKPLLALSSPPPGAPAAAATSMPGSASQPRTFASLSEARSALEASQSALEQANRDVQNQVSIDQLFASCGQAAGAASQVDRLQAASDALTRNAAPGGAWHKAAADAIASARGALELAGGPGSEKDMAARSVNERRSAAAEAAKATEKAREAARAAKAEKQKELTQAAEEAAAAQERAERELKAAEARVAELEGALPAIAKDAEKLIERSSALSQNVDALARQVARANALLAATPPVMQKRILPGDTARVSVERTLMQQGVPVEGAPTEKFESPDVEALSPIYFDFGVGPALTLGRNTEDYGTVIRRDSGAPRLVGARTEQELILDGILSFSAYIWGPRYLDDRGWDASFLLPRPMFALSLTEPLTSIYAGLSIDPLQFVDISGGVRWGTVKTRIGWRDTDGNLQQPEEPAVREEVKPSGFVAITFSTDLIFRWAKREFR